MAQQAFLAKVIGIPTIPSITEVNIRSGSGTNFELIFKVPVGTTDISIIEVKKDNEGKNLNGKIYQWFRAQFQQGVGWVRDDLIEIWGDGTGTGYPIISNPTIAHNLSRDTSSVAPGAETAATTQPSTSSEVVTTEPATESEVVSTTKATSFGEALTTQPSSSSEVVTTEPAATAPTGPAMALSIAKTGGNGRSGSGTGHAATGIRFAHEDTASVLDTKLGDDGIPLNWVKLSYQGREIWVREDLVRLSGNFNAFGLNAPDKYPTPVPETWWVRGWDPTGTGIWPGGKHNGWDLGGVKGSTSVLAGPQGAVVFKVAPCAKCGSGGISAIDQGIPTSSVWRDPSWNYGYGHFIIVGYENSKLPASTQKYLADNGKSGWHIFVMHAHLHKIMTEKGDVLAANQQFALLGNSGNSYGAHLHLEVRASQNITPRDWDSLKPNLMSPGVLFLR